MERQGNATRAEAPDAESIQVPAEGVPRDTEVAFVSCDLFVGGTRHRLTPRFHRFVDPVLAAPGPCSHRLPRL